MSCEVHLWKYELKEFPAKFSFPKLLSQDELARSQHFIRHEDGKRFAWVHAFQRDVLSRYLHLPSNEIQFAMGPNKKPILKTRAAKPAIHFNLSYRNKYALLAISSKASIGVDIEEVGSIPDFTAFVSDYFSREEQQIILEKKTKEEQLSLLFTLWTMKEALLKSLSIGVKGTFATYNLCPFLQQSSGVLSLGKQRAWNISPVSIAESYKAAFAVAANQVHFKMFEYGKD